MNLLAGIWHGTARPPRQCVHEDERGRRCAVVFTPARNEAVNTRRCPEHRGRLVAVADNHRKKRRRRIGESR